MHAFIAIAEDLSLRKAARRLGVSQPALSRQIQQLEQELGLTLFVRHPDGIKLTRHGTLMLEHARRLSQAAREFTEHVRSSDANTRGTVRLGITWGLWDTVSRLAAHHAARAAGIGVLGVDILSAAQGDALRQRRIDVGLARPPLDTRELRCDVLYQEPVVAVLPAGHALAGRTTVRLAELADERLLLHDRELAPGIYDKILELYAEAGIAPHIVPTSASPASSGGLIQVASGKGISMGLGGLQTFAETPGIAVVRLEDPGASLPIYAVWRASESSPIVLQFVDSIRDVFHVPRGSDASRASRGARGGIGHRAQARPPYVTGL